MARTRPRFPAGALGAVLLFLIAPACHLAGARIWNLEQLHDPDGRPRRRANLHGDFEHLFANAFAHSNFGGEDFRRGQQAEKRVADPYGTCLENVLALADCSKDAKVVAQQAVVFAWLARDCTYGLSRERCVFELGEVLRLLGAGETEFAVPAQPAGPADVAAAVEQLIEATRGVLAAPGLGTKALAKASEDMDALALERQGALRATRATLGLLEGREQVPEFELLRLLRISLARRCAVLALVEALGADGQGGDGSGRVQAAALEVATRHFPAQRERLLRAALTGPTARLEEGEELRLRAFELLARNGLPPSAPGEEAEASRAGWNALLVDALQRQNDGRTMLAVTRALARLNDRPLEPRPEAWISWWRARTAAANSPGGEG